MFLNICDISYDNCEAGRIRVLYVDDEISLLEITKIFLQLQGDIEVDTESSPPTALAVLEHQHYDTIISDYQMPEMDGIRFLKTLRARGDLTPFIIFTGRGREEVAMEALNNGADFYLQKGGDANVQFSVLRNAVLQLIGRSKAQKELKESEEKYRLLVESAHCIIMRLSLDGGVKYVNNFGRAFFRFSEDELLGKHITDLVGCNRGVPDVDLAEVISKMRDGVWNTMGITARSLKKEGEEVWVGWTIRPIKDGLGHPSGILCFGNELASQKGPGPNSDQVASGSAPSDSYPGAEVRDQLALLDQSIQEIAGTIKDGDIDASKKIEAAVRSCGELRELIEIRQRRGNIS